MDRVHLHTHERQTCIAPTRLKSPQSGLAHLKVRRVSLPTNDLGLGNWLRFMRKPTLAFTQRTSRVWDLCDHSEHLARRTDTASATAAIGAVVMSAFISGRVDLTLDCFCVGRIFDTSCLFALRTSVEETSLCTLRSCDAFSMQEKAGRSHVRVPDN